MGADHDDCGSPKPHFPGRKNPKPPCDDELQADRPPIVVIPRSPPLQQVTEPAGYAVAGKILLAAAGALAGVLLALVAMYLYNTSRRRRLANGGGGRRRLGRSPAIAGGDDRDDYGAATPRGLDPAVIRALPVVVVVATRDSDGAGDCAVCLGDLRPGEKARALPRCAHVFHADCIDAWFRGNATCPLCRADVLGAAPPRGEAEAVAAPPPQEVRVDVRVDGAADAKAASTAAAMGRLPSGTDLDKTRRVFFASTRSVSF